MSEQSYVGLWVTSDNHVQQRLLPNGRYEEARGTKEKAYTGSYRIEGNEIFYSDDSGFEADGVFKDGVLYHVGMLMHRREES
jgi:hypothetical protein